MVIMIYLQISDREFGIHMQIVLCRHFGDLTCTSRQMKILIDLQTVHEKSLAREINAHSIIIYRESSAHPRSRCSATCCGFPRGSYKRFALRSKKHYGNRGNPDFVISKSFLRDMRAYLGSWSWNGGVRRRFTTGLYHVCKLWGMTSRIWMTLRMRLYVSVQMQWSKSGNKARKMR